MITTIRIARLAVALLVAVGLALPAPSAAQDAASKSLDKCQKTAAKESAKHLKGHVKAVAKCMQKISAELIKKGNPDPSGAAKSCASSLRKIVNTVASNKTVAEKAKTKMRKACDPTVNPGLAHNAPQVTSLTPVGVPQGIEAKELNGFCTVFGDDGSIDSVQEWVDCQLVATRCEANQQLSVEYPRILEWLTLIQPHIDALGMDPKYTDPSLAIDQLLEALDSNGNMEVDINCGPGNSECGNGILNAGEECDTGNLDGETCVSVGFPDGGTLACKGTCGFNYQGCISSTFSKTGQTTVYEDDDDGDIQAGPPFTFVDNGDGTISDLNTGLTWEKLSDDGSIHDISTSYTWSEAFTVKVAALNTMPCFAGHCDWRVPNRHELVSLLDFGAFSPALRPEFNVGCTLNCTVLTCSCGPAAPLWSSTTWAASTGQAWATNFLNGRTDPDIKTLNKSVRAVRGPD